MIQNFDSCSCRDKLLPLAIKMQNKPGKSQMGARAYGVVDRLRKECKTAVENAEGLEKNMNSVALNSTKSAMNWTFLGPSFEM